MLARGELHCIGATTLDEYREYIEKDPALERRFQPIMVEQPTVEDTISILRGLKERYEVFHGVKIQDGALIAAATLSDRYITDRFFARQGHRPGGRGLRHGQDRDGLDARRAGRFEPPHHPAADRAGQPEEGDRRASRQRLAALEKELAELRDGFNSKKPSGRTRKTPSARCRTCAPRWSPPRPRSKRPPATAITPGPASCSTASCPTCRKSWPSRRSWPPKRRRAACCATA